MLIWLDTPAEGLAADGGILRADEVQAVMAADAVRRSARDRRTALLEQAAREAEAITEAARMQASDLLSRAHAQGQKLLHAAQEQAREEVETGYGEGHTKAAAEWHDLLEQRREARASALEGMEAHVAEIVATAVERIVSGQPRSALLQQALQQVQQLARASRATVMRVAPEDVEEAQAAVKHMCETARGEPPVIEVRGDARLWPGGCVFESEQGMLDASLYLQLHGLRVALGCTNPPVGVKPEETFADEDANDEEDEEDEEDDENEDNHEEGEEGEEGEEDEEADDEELSEEDIDPDNEDAPDDPNEDPNDEARNEAHEGAAGEARVNEESNDE